MFTAVLVVEAAAKRPPVMMLLAPLKIEILFCPTICVLVILLLFDHPYSHTPLVLFTNVTVLFDEVVSTVPFVLPATFTPRNLL